MTQFVNIDECEKEVEYLRDQNQKLLKELSLLARENAFLREQFLVERTRCRKFLENAGKNQYPAGDPEKDDFCLN